MDISYGRIQRLPHANLFARSYRYIRFHQNNQIPQKLLAIQHLHTLLLGSGIIFHDGLFSLYRITSERSDFRTGLGCCLHHTTVIRYAPRREIPSAFEVLQKVMRYVPHQCKQRIRYAPVRNPYQRVRFRNICMFTYMLINGLDIKQRLLDHVSPI